MTDMTLLDVVANLRTTVRLRSATIANEATFYASIANVWWAQDTGIGYHVGSGKTAEEALADLCVNIDGRQVYRALPGKAFDTSAGLVEIGHCEPISQADLHASGRLVILPSEWKSRSD